MAELGETSDPRGLIPGRPGDVESDVDAYRTQAHTIESVGHDLARITVESWVGQASGTFHDTFAKEPSRWFRASDALNSSADALSDYAGTLRWSQSQAEEAIRLWESGEKATREALAAHQAALASARASATAGDAEPSVPEFSDPGEDQRQQARELLDRARTQLDEAGITASGRIETDMIDRKFEGPSTDFQFNGPSLSTSGGPHAGLGSFVANLQLFNYTARPDVSFGGIPITPEVSLWVGSKHEAGAEITKNGFDFNFSHFVGAQLGTGADGEIGGVDFDTGGEVWVGRGYEAGYGATVEDDGTTVIEGEWGMAPRGYGAGVNFHAEIPPEELADFSEDVNDAVDSIKDRFTW